MISSAKSWLQQDGAPFAEGAKVVISLLIWTFLNGDFLNLTSTIISFQWFVTSTITHSITNLLPNMFEKVITNWTSKIHSTKKSRAFTRYFENTKLLIAFQNKIKINYLLLVVIKLNYIQYAQHHEWFLTINEYFSTLSFELSLHK